MSAKKPENPGLSWTQAPGEPAWSAPRRARSAPGGERPATAAARLRQRALAEGIRIDVAAVRELSKFKPPRSEFRV